MLAATERDAALASLKSIFFNKEGEERKAKSLVTKAIAENVKALFADERTRAVALFDKLKSARAVERSVALQKLADAVISHYQRLKQVRGLLDFDDLIEAVARLLRRSEAGWVLYKLDQGIDHVLVDEAQDTSPKQWSILKALVDEFFSGASARNCNAHHLRRRRREAVDLFVPGRGAASSSGQSKHAFRKAQDRTRQVWHLYRVS
jgi:ATP-dependent helicase/nuclease subunit A